MARPCTNQVRWLLFDDDELLELRTGLEAIWLAGDGTTESEALVGELLAEEESRKLAGGKGLWALETEV